MAKYLLVYSGGSMPKSPEDQGAVMAAWMAWFGSLGDAVVDGGDPTMPMPKTVSANGSVMDGPAGMMVSGYSILKAGSCAAAVEMASGICARKSRARQNITSSIQVFAMH